MDDFWPQAALWMASSIALKLILLVIETPGASLFSGEVAFDDSLIPTSCAHANVVPHSVHANSARSHARRRREAGRERILRG